MASAKSKSSTKKSSSAPARAGKDAIAELKADHKEVKSLYKEFKALSEAKAAPKTRENLGREICRNLTIHATVEEEILYPAARKALKDKSLVLHAEVEHGSAKDLISQIDAMTARDALFDATVCVLCEYVDHHVKEEEGELFPALRETSLDLVALGEDIRAARDRLAEADDRVDMQAQRDDVPRTRAWDVGERTAVV